MEEQILEKLSSSWQEMIVDLENSRCGCDSFIGGVGWGEVRYRSEIVVEVRCEISPVGFSPTEGLT